MKIQAHNAPFEYISDDSRECDSRGAFLLSKSSKRYEESARKNGCIHFIAPKDLARFLQLDVQIVGITGTNGKTTTSAAIYSMLLDLGYQVALLGTRGFFINEELIAPKGLTTPPLLEVYEHVDRASKAGCQFFIMEVSSHAIDQERIEGLNFALKILTNITSDHLDYHKSIENYIAVKNSFFSDELPKLINKDEPRARFNPKNALTYGIEHPSSYQVKAYSLSGGIDAQISFIQEQASLSLGLFGRHNLYNLLAAVAAVHRLVGGDLQRICEVAEHFGGVEGRMERVSEDPLIVVDFAHTEDGMKQIFESFPHRELVVVFGAGGDRDKSKRPRMGAMAERYTKRIYLTSDNPRSEDPMRIIEEIEAGIAEKGLCIKESNRPRAIFRAISELKANEVLLVLGKGDESEQIIGGEKVPMKDRETILEVLRELHANRKK
ncbi:MAG: UDP-N-acetylmuramoyl-L-alanyl-D-glutamate--2,6-diaminopimelate ligase [Wolinella sp.]